MTFPLLVELYELHAEMADQAVCKIAHRYEEPVHHLGGRHGRDGHRKGTRGDDEAPDPCPLRQDQEDKKVIGILRRLHVGQEKLHHDHVETCEDELHHPEGPRVSKAAVERAHAEVAACVQQIFGPERHAPEHAVGVAVPERLPSVPVLLPGWHRRASSHAGAPRCRQGAPEFTGKTFANTQAWRASHRIGRRHRMPAPPPTNFLFLP
mmetsp:Transcript_58235/g.125937  ORF Transcript_58235/g.125937 Transcript_58235/m.125937 type:complete len:208 (-) Transcript_58235:641-1264(-)